MRRLKGIELYFENCESSDLLTTGDMDDDDVYAICLENIVKNIWTVARNAVCERLVAKNIEIILNPKANRKTTMCDEECDDLFDRLLITNDITHIFLHWKDGTEEMIGTPWGGDSDYNNDYQTVKKLDDGRIQINIKEV